MALVRLALVLAPRLHLGDDSHASGSSVGLLDYVGYNSIVNNKYNDGCCVVHVRKVKVNTISKLKALLITVC